MTTVIDVNEYINSKKISEIKNTYEPGTLYKYVFTVDEREIPRGYGFVRSSGELVVQLNFKIPPNTWVPMSALCYSSIKSQIGDVIEGLIFENRESHNEFGKLLGTSKWKFGNFLACNGSCAQITI